MLIVFSGETADTLNALRYCKERGALIVGITNTGTANWQDIYLFIREISNNTDQLSSQFKLSVYMYFTIPLKVFLIECIQVFGLSM